MKKAEDKNLLKNEENQEAVYSRIFKTIKDLISNGNDKINELFVKSFGNNEELLNKYEEVTKINPIAIPSIVTFALPLIMHNVSVQAIVNSGSWVSFFKDLLHREKKSANEATEKDLEIILQKVNFLYKHNADFKNYVLDLESKLLKNEDFEKSISQLSESLHIDINNFKNEVNEKLDEIKEELRIVSSSNIEKMETALCKDPESSSVCSGANEPELFRPTGPMWIDFKGITKRKDSEKKSEKIVYVVKREEVDEIIDKVKNSNEDIIIIKGKPASGKSVVLRSIGYRLINDGFTVYYIQLKFFQSVEVLEFNKIRRGIVIVDDAHLNIELTEKLIRNKSKEIKLIIGTRDIKNYKPDSEAHFPELLKSAITIQAVDAAKKIIDKFNEIHNNILDKSVKNEIFKKSGNNLWILAWRLKAYEEYRELSTEKFKETVKNYISGLIKTNTIGELTGAIFILSIFYKYEIPLRKPFVKNFTSEYIINGLIRKNEIVQTTLKGKDYLSLHHSEIAKVYFETFKYFADFGYFAKKEIKELAEKYGLESLQNVPKTDASLIINYAETFPEEFNRFIGQVPDEIQDVLLQNKYFLNLVPEIFKSYQPFDDFNILLFYTERLIPSILKNESLKSKIDEICESIFEEKICKLDNLWNISHLLWILKKTKYKYLQEVLKSLRNKIFEEKIEKCDCAYSIAYILEVLEDLKHSKVGRIHYVTFEKKIKEWNSVEKIAYLLETMFKIKYKGLQKIDYKIFEKKIKEWNSVEKIAYLLETMFKIKYKGLQKIDYKIFEKKIKEWNSVEAKLLVIILGEIKYKKINMIKQSFLQHHILHKR